MRTALFATDLGPRSDRALDHVGMLREFGISDVVLFHALGLRHLKAMASLLAHEAESMLLGEAAVLQGAGFNVETVLAPGLPALEIPRYTREFGAMLVVLADSGPKRRLMPADNVLAYVLCDLSVPVLILSNAAPEERLLARVLVCTRCTASTSTSLRWLGQLASFGVGHLTLLHVQESRGHRQGERRWADQIDAARLARLSRDWTGTFTGSVNWEVARGRPAEEIVGHARSGAANLLVMAGSRQWPFLQGLSVGTPRLVAGDLPCPVILVPAGAAAFTPMEHEWCWTY